MNICIDIQAAVAQRAGVGRYTRALVEHLGADRGTDRVRLFYFDFQRRGRPFATPGIDQQAIRWLPGRIAQKSWKTLGWPPFDWFAGRADLYHFTNFIIPPLRRGKTVVTIYDVSFLCFPEFAERRNLAYLTARVADTVRRADAIITISQFSAREIMERLGVPRDKITSVYPGIDQQLKPPDREETTRWRQAHGLTRPYCLTVGTLEPRKNLEFLISVFEILPAFDGELVMAGMRGWKYESILKRMRTSSRARRIRYLDYVPDRDLPFLYGGAELFLFPSRYEGFGLPPLEAMACGTPVIASPEGALAEVLGDGARLMRDFNAEAWSAEVVHLLEDTSARQSWIDKGLRQAAHYRWQDTARQTWAVYRQVGT